MQFMAEATVPNDIEPGFGDSDIEQNVYEGGFKSWEGATDLALLLLDRFHDGGGSVRDLPEHCIELGCGTALPSLTIFHICLTTGIPLKLTLADYNSSVLAMVTVANLLLVWALHASLVDSPSASSDSTATEALAGDLEITPGLLDGFCASLREKNIDVEFVSGTWSPDLIPLLSLSIDERVLVLAAETIYSPAATLEFTDTLLAMLSSTNNGMALVAAKKVYFGVGGSVGEFVRAVVGAGGEVMTLTGTGIAGADPDLESDHGGVARWLGEVTLREIS